MNSSSREEALFHAALERVGQERAAYLDRACAGDPGLRKRLEALLEAHAQPNDLPGLPPESARPTIRVEFAETPDPAIGASIGRYKLLEKIGEGGWGVVYVAEQTEPIRRRVALKVIKAGMDTKQVVARFEAERQALALMEHPNIAKVLDAGTVGTEGAESRISNLKSQIPLGRPYFVMELVRGLPITEYCDQAKLSTRERIELFIRVCHAIQHAHQKGIIHRDVKPSNILVTLHDGVPVPKVIDFGIAKAISPMAGLTDATVYTQLHQFIGTPAYMSPEQAEMSGLDIDTRSDIYSLGVVLYELLTGKTPFDPKELMAGGIDGMRRAVREQEPVRPSTRLTALQGEELTTTAQRRSADPPRLVTLLKGDLDWIVMKCLEKDRTRRYETAAGLGADLQRHLNHETVSARPPSTVYRLQKAWQRHRLAFAAGSVVIAALVVGVVALAFALARERQLHLAQQEEAQARQTAQAEAARAQAVAAFVVGLLDRSAGTMSQQGNIRGLRSLLDAADVLTSARLTNSPAAELTVRATIWRYQSRILNEFRAEVRQGDRIRALLPAVSDQQLTVPGLLPNLTPDRLLSVRDYLRVHTIASRLWAGDTEWGRAELEGLRTEFLGRAPPATNAIALALCLEGFALHAMDRDAEAEPLLRRAFALAPRLTGFFLSDQTGLTYARTLMRLGKHREGELAVRESVRSVWPKAGLSAYNCYSALVESLCRQGRVTEAEAELREALSSTGEYPWTAEELLRLNLLGAAIQALDGQWQGAAPRFVELAAQANATPIAWRIGAAAALSQGDVAGYQRLCREARWRFGATAESESALFLTEGLLLQPADDDTLFALRSLLDRLEAIREEHWSGAFHPLLRAAFAYRSGRPGDALREIEAWEAARDTRMVRAVLLRDEQASPAPQFWKAMILAELNRPREAAAAFAGGQRRLGSGPPVGWELIQVTTSIYLGQALRSEAAQVFQRKGIPVPQP
ncbi:MAG TPA: serine/threonine-protein kinase [Verrucomicrobiota bacterium]|nr:serine/threonine-protein kinase [Verrucomicrobiota bacterium]HRZ37807.1 serine/threonine-protein kinase [Candidatus Paceibacterota bacterium]